MSRSLTLLALPLLLVASAPRIAGAVTGAPDTTDVAVGLVSGTGGICGATLIAPTLMLTAAHCVVGQNATVTLTDGGYTVTTITAFPGFNMPIGGDNDLAVITLDHATTITPLPLATAAPAAGDAVTLVGFGSDADGMATRRSATNTVGVLDGPTFEIDGMANACTDDAGGPILSLASGSPAIVGVIAAGGPAGMACANASFSTAVRAYLPWLAGAAPGATAVGGAALPTTDQPPTISVERPGDGATMPTEFRINVRVADDYGALAVGLTIDGTAQPGVTVTGGLVAVPVTLTDGKHALVLTVSDASAHTASTTLNLTVSSDYPATETGAACWDGTDCTSGVCAIRNGVHFCTSPCSLDSDCPNGLRCDTQQTFECVVGGGGGCATGQNSAPWLALVCAALGWLVLSRRTRRGRA